MGEYQAALDALDGGRAPPHAMITETVALTAMPATFEALRKRTTQCKVMVKPHQDFTKGDSHGTQAQG